MEFVEVDLTLVWDVRQERRRHLLEHPTHAHAQFGLGVGELDVDDGHRVDRQREGPLLVHQGLDISIGTPHDFVNRRAFHDLLDNLCTLWVAKIEQHSPRPTTPFSHLLRQARCPVEGIRQQEGSRHYFTPVAGHLPFEVDDEAGATGLAALNISLRATTETCKCRCVGGRLEPLDEWHAGEGQEGSAIRTSTNRVALGFIEESLLNRSFTSDSNPRRCRPPASSLGQSTTRSRTRRHDETKHETSTAAFAPWLGHSTAQSHPDNDKKKQHSHGVRTGASSAAGRLRPVPWASRSRTDPASSRKWANARATKAVACCAFDVHAGCVGPSSEADERIHGCSREAGAA
mmetsp:Transcript_170918/g.543100  ORF Transcript_170918/g.543100 Transcript_170918/m.543100 type:complete len:346 (+) Transcript_170918:504-1541(+)